MSDTRLYGFDDLRGQDWVEIFNYIVYGFISVAILARYLYVVRIRQPRSPPPQVAEALLERGDASGLDFHDLNVSLYGRASIKVLFPAQMVLSVLVMVTHVVVAVLAFDSNKAAAGTPHWALCVALPVCSNLVIASGWMSCVMLLRWTQQKISVIQDEEDAHNHGYIEGIASIRLWCFSSFVFYCIQCSIIDGGIFFIYVLNVMVVAVFGVLEVLKYRDLQALNSSEYQEVPSNSLRKREKNWILLLGIALQYVWPDSLGLKIRASVCLGLVILMRILNIAVPYFYKQVIDQFSSIAEETHPGRKHPSPIPFSEAFYPFVAIYLVLYFLQGGILNNIRQYLWIPISQRAYQRISLDVFSHVLALDHEFHLHRKTGEMLRIMDRGSTSIQTLLGTILFSIGPACFDIGAAAMFLAFKMQPWIAVIVFISLGIYIPMTIFLTEWRGQFRREVNQLDNARSGKATDALLNFETVKIFGNEGLETTCYESAIRDYQKMDYKLVASMNGLNVLQSLVIFAGLASGMLICTFGVSQGTLSVGDTVLFVTLMQQLFAPLNFFGSYYRMIQNAALDMEGVFRLLETEAKIQDHPKSAPFMGNNHEITFDNVSFAYHGVNSAVLNNISFTIPHGKTCSLVGQTGSGKSTILRLLLRLYDPLEGWISIGGQPLSRITLSSLRSLISVVPQDTVLFNDTIWYNIKYGYPDASDEDVIAAAKGACLYDTIMNKFPAGFETRVGERGLRLSGGEKQRVAFARAILKNPPILILDEATSSLDSITEHRIQEVLLSKRKDRTVLLVAHRLSTIADCDRIIVVEHGKIIEMGTHEELLENKRTYSQLWNKQNLSSSH